MAYSEYKVELIQDGGCSTFLFGSGNLPVDKVQKVINNMLKTDGLWFFKSLNRVAFCFFGQGKQS